MGLATIIRATPAVALGAYEMTPVTSRRGLYAFGQVVYEPSRSFCIAIVSANSTVWKNRSREARSARSSVAFLVTSLFEGRFKQRRAHGSRTGIRFACGRKNRNVRDGLVCDTRRTWSP